MVSMTVFASAVTSTSFNPVREISLTSTTASRSSSSTEKAPPPPDNERGVGLAHCRLQIKRIVVDASNHNSLLRSPADHEAIGAHESRIAGS